MLIRSHASYPQVRTFTYHERAKRPALADPSGGALQEVPACGSRSLGLHSPCSLRHQLRPCRAPCTVPSRQFGKGFRDEFLKERTKSRTRDRRFSNRDNSRSSSSAAEPYHFGGIRSTIAQSECSGKPSILLSQGSKLFHPVTPTYTSFRPKTPRRGASGRLHSPALKQYP